MVLVAATIRRRPYLQGVSQRVVGGLLETPCAAAAAAAAAPVAAVRTAAPRGPKNSSAPIVKMAATRIPIAWLLVLAALAVFAFFGYHIFNVAAETEKFPPYGPGVGARHLGGAAPTMIVGSAGDHVPADDGSEGIQESPAPVVQRVAVHPMPRVPGQTEADLREPEQIQRTPPTTEYDAPEHMDPLNATAHMSAEFGSNLRHPEQMIEQHPDVGMERVVASGLGGHTTSMGPHNAAVYDTEMTQNGAEVMEGIFAYDGTAEGSGYSML